MMTLAELLDKALTDKAFAGELQREARKALNAFKKDVSTPKWEGFIDRFFAKDANALSNLKVAPGLIGRFSKLEPMTGSSNPHFIGKAITTTQHCTLTITTTTSQLCPVPVEYATQTARKKAGTRKKGGARKRRA